MISAAFHGHPTGTPIHCDNDAASILFEEYVYHPRVKHIRVKYHDLRDLVEEGEIQVARVRSADNASVAPSPLVVLITCACKNAWGCVLRKALIEFDSKDVFFRKIHLHPSILLITYNINQSSVGTRGQRYKSR
jgi:hypothetical protein